MPKKVTLLDTDEEMMMWCAYRYAIGRHTYVTSLASYIAKTYYNRLSENRLEFTAKDIKDRIADSISFGNCSIHYDGSVPYNERDAFDDMMSFFSENIHCADDMNKYERIEFYKESYSEDSPKKTRIYTCEPRIERYNSQMDIDDLLPWYNLAQFFDKKNYVVCHVKYDGKEEDVVCFKSWMQSTEDIPDQPGYCKSVPFKWERCYISVDRFFEYGERSGYIYPNYIVTVNEVKK